MLCFKNNNIMKVFLSVILSILFLTNCSDNRTEYSDTLVEEATIVTLLYSPSRHDVNITRVNDYNPMNDKDDLLTTDYNGDQGLKISRNHQITSTTIPEKYGVAFQCKHGTFTVEGTESKYRVLWQKLQGHVNQQVNVLYREEYVTTYEKNDKGIKVPTSKVLKDLDFIDAQIKK